MVRTPTVILAPCSGTSNGTSSSVPCRAFLHYIAVMIANAGRENAPSLPSAFVSGEPAPPRGSEWFCGGCMGRAARADGISVEGPHPEAAAFAKVKKSSDQSYCSGAGLRVTRDILGARSSAVRGRSAPGFSGRSTDGCQWDCWRSEEGRRE
ncbi:hypothetical protein [Streptomyces rochei]|uniref:hypothetical protein n=1 Tax=Streptomyces rochei TaxID=1928 RepID=UPI0036CAE93C